MNQRAQDKALQAGKTSWLTQDRVQLLNRLDFEWCANPKKKKSGVKKDKK